MKTQSLISTSLAMILAAMPSFAKSDNLDALKRDVWNPNWMIPESGNGQIYYGHMKDATPLTKFDSKQIEFKSNTPPPTGNGFYTVFTKSNTSSRDTQSTATQINNLTFKFNGTNGTNGTPSESINSSANNTYTFTMKADANEPTIRLQLDKALDLGEYTNTSSSGSSSSSPSTLTNTSIAGSTQTKGTLTFDFDNIGTHAESTRRSMSLKLGSTKESDKDISLKGNLKVVGTNGGNQSLKAINNVQFKAELDGGVTGDILLQKTFTSNITIGKADATDQVIEIGGSINIVGTQSSNNVTYEYGYKHNLSINGYKNTIKGGIKSSGYSAGNNHFSLTNITIGKEGSQSTSIEGGVKSDGGILKLDIWGSTNSIKGEIRTDWSSTNNISLNGTTNTITGKIFSWAGTNNITFKGDTNKIEKGTSDNPAIVSGNGGTGNITFEKGSNTITGNISSSSNNTRGTINITFKEGTTDNKITGEIHTDYNSTNNINLNGSTNTIEGKINTNYGANKINFNSGENKIVGDVFATNNGTANITFSGTTNKIEGNLNTSNNGTVNATFNNGKNNITGRVAIGGSGSKIKVLFEEGTTENTIGEDVYVGWQGKVEVSMGGSTSNTIGKGVKGESRGSTLNLTISGGGTNTINPLNDNSNNVIYTENAEITTKFTSTNGTNLINGNVAAKGGTNTVTLSGKTNSIAGRVAIVDRGATNSQINITFDDKTKSNTIGGEVYTGWNGSVKVDMNGSEKNTIKQGLRGESANSTLKVTISGNGDNSINGGAENFDETTKLALGELYHSNIKSAIYAKHAKITVDATNSKATHINGSIVTSGGTNTITLASAANVSSTSRIYGDIFSLGRTDNGTFYQGKNIIEFNGNDNIINGNIVTKTKGLNKLEFKANSSSNIIQGDLITIGDNTTDHQNNSTTNISLVGNSTTLIRDIATSQKGNTNISSSGDASRINIRTIRSETYGINNFSIGGSNSTISASGLSMSSNGTLKAQFSGNDFSMKVTDSIDIVDGNNTINFIKNNSSNRTSEFSVKGTNMNLSARSLEFNSKGEFNVIFGGRKSNLGISGNIENTKGSINFYVDGSDLDVNARNLKVSNNL